MKIEEKLIEAAILGGAVLGGGGGGWMEEGRRLGKLALELGDPEIITIDELSEEAILLTVSAVGAPAAKERYVKPYHYIKAVEMLVDISGIAIDGLITNENGGVATVNGWIQSAALNIPIVDAPCNGRAHPTGPMGSMGLSKLANYVSLQTAVGGNPRTGSYVEVFVRGNLERAANLVRQAAIQAGGLVAVARNPVSAEYVKNNGAPGAIRQAIAVGEAMLVKRAVGGRAMIEAALKVLQGEMVVEGRVEKVELETKGGFDVGKVLVKDSEILELTFWNEYMTLELKGRRIATFPDLIMTMDLETGLPLTSAAIKEGERVAVLHVPKNNLILGAGMRDAKLFEQVEVVIGKEIIKYVF